MSNGLPTFEERVPFEPQVDTDPVTGLEEIAREIGNFSNRLEQFGARRSDVLAQIKGRELGARKTFKPKTPLTMPDLLEEQTAITTHQSVVASDIRTHVTALRDQMLTSGSDINSLQNFQNSLKGWYNSYRANLVPIFHGVADRAFNLYGGEAHLQVAHHVAGLIKATNTENAKEGLSEAVKEAVTLMHNGKFEEGKNLYETYAEPLGHSAANGTLSSDILSQIKKGAKDLNLAAYVGEYRIAKQRGTGVDFFNKIRADKSVNDVDKNEILAKLMADDGAQDRQINFMAKSLEEHAKVNLEGQALKGKASSELVQTSLNNLSPEQGKEYKTASESAQQFSQLKAAANETDPEKFKALLAEVPQEAGIDHIMRQALLDFNQNQDTLLKKDPAAFAENTAFVKSAVVAASKTPAFQQASPAERNILTTRAVTDAVINYQRARNVPEEKITVIPKNRLNTIIADIQNAPIGKRPEIIAQFLNQFSPTQRHIVSEQFAKELPSVDSWLYQITADPATAKYSLDAQQAFQEPLQTVLNAKDIKLSKIEAQSGVGNMQAYMNVLGMYPGTSTAALADFKDKWRKLTAHFAPPSATPGDIETAAQKAAGVLLSNLNFDSYNGFGYFYQRHPNMINESLSGATPQEIPTDKVKDALDFTFHTAFFSDDLNIPSQVINSLRGAPTQGFDKATRENLMDGAHFLPLNGSGHKLVLVDQYGAKITHGPDKKTFIVTVNDLSHPLSPLNKSIATFKKNLTLALGNINGTSAPGVAATSLTELLRFGRLAPLLTETEPK